MLTTSTPSPHSTPHPCPTRTRTKGTPPQEVLGPGRPRCYTAETGGFRGACPRFPPWSPGQPASCWGRPTGVPTSPSTATTLRRALETTPFRTTWKGCSHQSHTCRVSQLHSIFSSISSKYVKLRQFRNWKDSSFRVRRAGVVYPNSEVGTACTA